MAETKTTNVYKALLKAQQDMGPVLKNATNPTFRSKYADLSSVIETIAETLHDNGILFVQPLTVIDGEQYIKTDLIHVESDTSTNSTYKVVCKDMQDPQKVGAAITYGRRYSLLSALGLAPEDDDGNSASTPPPSSSKPSPVVNKTTGEVIGTGPEDTPDGVCSHCSKNVPGKSVYWSNKKYGRTLCWDDQQLFESGQLPETPPTQTATDAYGGDNEPPF